MTRPLPAAIGPSLANGLHRLRGEIGRSLAVVRTQLERCHEDGLGGGGAPDPRPLLGAADALRQVSGTFAMLQCFGAAIVADEMQHVVAAALTGKLPEPPVAFAALSAAALQLSDYIDVLATGAPDCAIVLQPVVNELRVARAAPVLDTAGLFALQAAPLVEAADAAFDAEGPAVGGDAAKIAAESLADYQRHFVVWFRNGDGAAAGGMKAVAARVAATAAQPPVRRAWRSLAVLFEALENGPATVTPELKFLIGRSSMALKQLAERGETAAAPAAGALAVQALFGVLQIPDRPPAAQRLIAATQVSAVLPDGEAVARMRARLRAPGAGVLERVEMELRRDFQAVEDALDLAVRTQGRAGEGPQVTVERLTRIGATLGVLGLPRLQQVVRNQAVRVAALAVGDPQWLEVATALVRVQDALGRMLGAPDPSAVQAVDAPADTRPPGAEYVAFATAALVECGRVETALAEYARDADAQQLGGVPAQLRNLARGLEVAGLEGAAQALAAVSGCVQDGGLAAIMQDPEARARLADALAAFGLYLEAVRDRVPHPEMALARFARCVAPLQRSVAESAARVPMPSPAPAATAPAASAGGAVDAEIRAIFLDEAQEVVATIRRALPRLRHDLHDRDGLAEIRRGFHTLKGSGRMVGASGVATFAWAVEQLLNRCLDGTLSVRTPILALVEAAATLLPRLLVALQAGDASASGIPEAAQLEARADALRQGGEAEAGSDLYAVFRDDARARLGFVGKWLAGQDAGADVAVEPDVVRAFHTLRGSAAVAHAKPVQRVAGELEGWLERVHRGQGTLDAGGRALLAAAHAALERWIGTNELAASAATESTALAAQLAAARTALAAPDTDRDAYTFAALEALQDAEAEVRAWCEGRRPDGAAQAGGRYAAVAASAALHGCPMLAEVARALADRLQAAQARPPSPALVPALEDVFEALYQRLDALRDGIAEADPAAVLDQIAGLPLVARQHPPPVPATVPGLQEIFLEEARDLLRACRAELAGMARPEAEVAAQRLQRTLHTLKGSARMAGELELGEVAQRIQQRLETAPVHHPADAALLAELEAGCAALEKLWRQAGGQDDASPVAGAEVHADAGLERSGTTAAQAALSGPDTAAARAAGSGPAAGVGVAPQAGLPVPAPDPELLQVFIPEAADLLEALDQAVAHWEEADGQAAARRALHTLKGSARVAGLDAISDAAHALEAALAAQGGDSAAARHALQAGLEQLHALCDALQRGRWQAPRTPASPESGARSPWGGELRWTPPEDVLERAAGLGEFARIPVEVLDRMLGAAGEAGTQRMRLVAHTEGLRTQLGEMARTVDRVRTQLRLLVAETDAQIAARGLRPQMAAGGGADDRYAQEFDPLEMDRYSHMQELSRTLAEAVDDLGDLHATMDHDVGEADALLGQQGQILAGVQQELMATLLVPFSREQGRLERVVRQTAHAVGKSAALYVEGAHTELDRNVLQRVIGPLEHLLRNAVVHGIEAPAERRAAGKALEGRVQLRVRREAGQIVLEVSDDGRGLDFAAIRRKGIERGLIAAQAALSDEQVARLIFEPEFSTAEVVTPQAGRGIGLDVVAAVTRQLGGRVELHARPGTPLAITLYLPLSMAVAHALLVRVGGERYMLPLVAVAGVARIPVAELPARLQAQGAPVTYGDDDYAVHYLGDFLDLARPVRFDGRSAVAVLVRAGETLAGVPQRVALVVDALLGTREVLTKSAGAQLTSIEGIAGAAALPDGGVAITLDVAALVARRAHAVPVAGGGNVPSPPTVMVIDDSVTMRRVAERLLVRNGFRVVTARDGLEAMDLLRDETPAVVLLDIEMPRADGFEVAAFIRHDERIRDTPIIVITSRSGDKHRERARRLGVDRYLIKPWQEQQLLDEIAAVRRSRAREQS